MDIHTSPTAFEPHPFPAELQAPAVDFLRYEDEDDDYDPEEDFDGDESDWRDQRDEVSYDDHRRY